MNNYKLQAPYEPNGDQPEAIKKLVKGVNNGKQFQTLLGATGTGKTFTLLNEVCKSYCFGITGIHNVIRPKKKYVWLGLPDRPNIFYRIFADPNFFF